MHEQDALLEAFYNQLDEGEKYFFANRFIDGDDAVDDYKLDNGSDNNVAEKKLM